MAPHEVDSGLLKPGHLAGSVKTQVVRAMTKVGARDRAQLVSFIFRAGLCSRGLGQ